MSNAACCSQTKDKDEWRTLCLPDVGDLSGEAYKLRAPSTDPSRRTNYEINRSCVIRRLDGKFTEEGVISQYTSCEGYLSASLSVPSDAGGTVHTIFKVHVLGCWLFNGPTTAQCMTVDHKDKKPWSNHISNLRWASNVEQAVNKMPRSCTPLRIMFIQRPGEIFVTHPDNPTVLITNKLRIVRNGWVTQDYGTKSSMPTLDAEEASSIQSEPSITRKIKKPYPRIKVNNVNEYVHLVVWRVFNPNGPLPKIVHHHDNDVENFWIDNLRCSNASDNGIQAHASGSFNGTKRQRQPVEVRAAPVDGTGQGKLWTWVSVDETTKKKTIKPAIFYSQCAAGKALDVSQGSICRSIHKKSWFTATKDGVHTKLWAFAATAPAAVPKSAAAPEGVEVVRNLMDGMLDILSA